MTTKAMKATISSADMVDVKQFWDLESIGIKDEQRKEEDALKLNIEKRKDRYFVNMSGKENHQILGDNYNLSRTRMSSTVNKQHKNPDLLKEYTRIMTEQENLGIIEEINSEEESEVLLSKLHATPRGCKRRQGNHKGQSGLWCIIKGARSVSKRSSKTRNFNIY